ncbi:F0F1 ATP synthase subunit gamma [Leuconostocaceae bacterium ESL0958]|nr:F0F1 ATP synthase subunit gamma [Leuconostocaceae bacterium ESL0958]
MASLQDIKRRIASTTKTKQITAAVELVSTAKLNQIQHAAPGYHQYADRLKVVVEHLVEAHLLDNVDASHIPMVDKRPVKKTGVLIVTSDKGMVGSYNANVIKQTNALLERNNLTPDNAVILAIGGNGAEFYKKRGYTVVLDHRGVSDVPTFNELRQALKTVMSLYEAKAFDELHLVYNHFVNRLTAKYQDLQLLPLTKDTLAKMEGNRAEDDSEHENQYTVQSAYDSEPDSTAVLNVVLPQYVQALIFEAILDAKTAEHAASSTAMSSATDSAKDIIGTLSLQYNRARQAQITTEITEITGGMVALE